MFKKTSAFLLALMLVLTLMPFAPNVMAAEKPITVMLLGNKLSFDTEPVIINDRTMVPMRAVFEGLGMTVSWDDITRRVTATGGGKEIVLTVGSENALVNGEGVDLDSPPIIIEGRTLVPLRFIGEASGLRVFWSTSPERRVTIMPPLSDELKTALQRFDSALYSKDMIDWIVGLYDPETTGFYFKKNAKDTEGFLPDRESTAKCIGTVAKLLNATSADVINEYTPEMKEKLLRFAQMYQSDEDGYWYEAPWGKYINDSKRLYQSSAAKQLISLAGGKPLYKTAEERIGESAKKTADKAELQKNRFASEEDFKNWFENYLDWDKSLYVAGSLLLSSMSEILKAGYFDLVKELIENKIDPETGLLGFEVDGEFPEHTVNLDAMSGTYKIAGYYNESYYPSKEGRDFTMPYYDKLMDSTMRIILDESLAEKRRHVCDISNAWSLIKTATYTQKTISSETWNSFVSNLPAMINITVEYALKHKTADGGYTYYAGIGAGGNQGMIHAYSLSDGEMSGASMILALRDNVYNTVCLNKPILFDDITVTDFVDMLKEVKPTPKIVPASNMNYTFDDMETGPLPQNNGFRSTGNITIEEDPDYIGERTLKIESDGNGRPVLIIDAGTRNGKGFTCEFDIKFYSANPETSFLVFEFGSYDYATVLGFRKNNGGYIMSRTADKGKNVKTLPDWTDYKNVKVEYNPSGGAEAVKLYLDGVLLDTCCDYKGSYPDKPVMKDIPAISVRADHDGPFTAYIDNFKFAENK